MTIAHGIKHEGLHRWRLCENSEERTFAVAWKNENERPCGRGLLEWLLGTGSEPVDVTPRDAQVAATVVQWLGSPVGQGFLKDLGYVKITPEITRLETGL